MDSTLRIEPAAARSDESNAAMPPAWIAIALIAPMFVSAALFHTYDIAMDSMLLEILRQFNAPFLVAEAIVIFAAWRRGFRLAALWSLLDRKDRLALLVFFACFWVGATFTSQIAPFATMFNLTYALHFVFMGSVLHLTLTSPPQSIAPFAKVIAWALVVFAAAIFLKFLNPPVGRAIDTIRWQFAIPGMISVRLFGALLAPFVVLFVYLSLSDLRHRIGQNWPIVAAAFASGLLVWTGTRAGILSAAIVLCVAVVRYRMKVLNKRFAVVLAACVGGALIGVALVPYGDLDFVLFVPGDAASANAVTSGRLGWWRDLLAAYSEFPAFGFGPGASSYILGSAFAPHIQPHNFVIEFLLNWGLMAAVAALFLLVRAHLAAHRAARQSADVVPYVLMADCLLVIGLFDGTFHFAQHLTLWAASIGIALAALQR